MATPAHIVPLLVLQDRDRRRLDLAGQLKALPADIAAVEGKIAQGRAAIDTARTELRELEAKKKLLETEIGGAEGKLTKYRQQQLEVKKNDEYRALGLEIEHMQDAIGKLEEDEIGVLYSIEEAKKRFAAAEADLKASIAGHEEKLAALRQKVTNVTAEQVEAEGSYTAERANLTEQALRVYDRVRLRHTPPACVPVVAGKCSGCHLKVSGELDSEMRLKEVRFCICDQCGRLVWLD